MCYCFQISKTLRTLCCQKSLHKPSVPVMHKKRSIETSRDWLICVKCSKFQTSNALRCVRENRCRLISSRVVVSWISMNGIRLYGFSLLRSIFVFRQFSPRTHNAVLPGRGHSWTCIVYLHSFFFLHFWNLVYFKKIKWLVHFFSLTSLLNFRRLE